MRKAAKAAAVAAMAMCVIAAASCSLVGPQMHGSAYVISVGLDYRNSAGVSSLSGTCDDAFEFGECYRAVMGRKGVTCDVTYMVAEGTEASDADVDYPSADAVLQKISDTFVDPNDLLVFYYSGHGDTLGGGEAALVTGKTAGNHYTELRMDDLFKALEAKGCQCLCIIDACYSGAAAIDSLPDDMFGDALSGLLQKTDLRSTAVLAASSAYETSVVSSVQTLEGAQQKHGAFTIPVLEKLGWVHSESAPSAVTAGSGTRKVYGYLGSVPDAMTAEELFLAATESWSYLTQTPCSNSTETQVMAVPRI